MKYTDTAKQKLNLAITVLQLYGKPGTLILDQLLKASTGPIDKQKILAEVQRRCQNTATRASK